MKKLLHQNHSGWLVRIIICYLYLLAGLQAITAQPSENSPHTLRMYKSPSEFNGLLDSILYENYQMLPGAWSLESKFQYSYDEAGHKRSYAAFVRNKETYSWANLWKEEYITNTQGLVTESVFYMWDAETGWILNRKQDLDFNEAGNLLGYQSYSWNGITSSWDNAWKAVYQLNDAGKATEDVFFQWNAVRDDWENNYRDVFQYDVDGNLTESTGSVWDVDQEVWVSDVRTLYAWDEHGNNIVTTGYAWNPTTGSWTTDSKTESEFDSEQNPVTKIYLVWNEEASDWQNQTRTDYQYYTHEMTRVEVKSEWDQNKGEWVDNLRRSYYYHAQPTDIRTVDGLPSSFLFPNPAETTVMAFVPHSGPVQVVLFDLEGREVLSLKTYPGIPLSISNLPHATYIYKIFTDTGVRTGKLLLLKRP